MDYTNQANWIEAREANPKKGDKKYVLYASPKCPFCQRVWSFLEHYQIPYEYVFINLEKERPAWYKQLNEKGTVPTLEVTQTQEVIDDSMKALTYLQEEERKRPLPAEKERQLISNIWKCFFSTLQSSDKKANLSALEEALAALESHFVEQDTQYLSSNDLSFNDFYGVGMMSRFPHPLKHHYGWELKNCPRVARYLTRLLNNQAVERTNLATSFYASDFDKYVKQ